MRCLIFLIFLLFALGCSGEEPWGAAAHNTVSFESSFSEEEKAIVMEGFNIWERDTGLVSFVEAPNGKIFVKKATSEEQAYWDKKKEPSTPVGLADKDEYTIYFMMERVESPSYLRLVAAHEAGHFLGLNHVPQRQTAVMNPALNSNLKDNPYLTRYDLDLFCAHWGCDL